MDSPAAADARSIWLSRARFLRPAEEAQARGLIAREFRVPTAGRSAQGWARQSGYSTWLVSFKAVNWLPFSNRLLTG